MRVTEPTTIGLTAESHDFLKSLKADREAPDEERPFTEMKHGYLFAIGLALAMGEIAPKSMRHHQAFLNRGSLDPNGQVLVAVKALRGSEDSEEPIYRTAERLAEWGVQELKRRAAAGPLTFGEIFRTTRPRTTSSG